MLHALSPDSRFREVSLQLLAVSVELGTGQTPQSPDDCYMRHKAPADSRLIACLQRFLPY
jgi:hypothetical protein